MDRNTNPDAAGSSGKDELRVHLDLNKLEGDAYGEFIKGIVNIYNPQEKRQRLCDTVGKHVPRETEIFKEMNDQIGLCFDGWNLPKLDDMDDNCGEDPRAQTPLEAEIPASEKFFQVRLTYDQHILDILIQKSSLYLVGYKWKYKLKEEEAMLNPDDKAKIDDNADYWIILSGGCCKAAVQFVEEFLTPDKYKEVKLGSSYFSLLSPFDSELETKKQKALAKNLYKRLTGRLKMLNGDEKTDYIVGILQKLKTDMAKTIKETMLGEELESNWEWLIPDEELVDQYKRAEYLLEWLRKRNYSLETSEPAGDKKAEEFKKFWRQRFQKLRGISDRDAMEKLVKMLEVKHKLFLSQRQNGTDEEKQESDFNQSLIPWETEIREAVKILSSLGYEIIIETKTGETNKDMLKRKEKEKKKRKREGKTEEELKKDLPEKIRLIKLLEKVIPQEDGSTGEIKKILTEELEEECGQLLETDKAAKLDRGIIDSYREVMMATDLYDFYEKLEKIRHVLENQMKALGIGASCRVQNEKIKEFELNRHALVRAFEHLTQYPFDEDDQKDFAKHITHLVVMICEATRFEPIAEHIKRSYTLELGSKLSDKNVALINMWSDISGVMVRGWSYKGERDFGLEDLMKAVTVSRAREWKGLGKEL
ncbi:uncharacterized protein LOC108202106 [Daucus carota subsp. sativus]|uniref:uncharacterized protein LOC108202106 n=1 Tax=Daucus carota subsp. sativus TaxID=79200 RepID=UPI0007EF3BE1|nr:PREDICTED: uncharacterized protein LOC108202106 [Daucus carota subsp. sativus]